ncbi:41167_t:CDS:2 [Gigaspora margarita]|uniref:41167_t:CDS:1 n=1 Tax=Gigaspora margarita TaxID=4874 RepID=A0ABN7V8X4_GIGMA|nr:41167_t:CDS:2 [Gigaspora margarita]
MKQEGDIMEKRRVGHEKVTFEDSNLLLEKCYKTSTNCHRIVKKESFTVFERSDKFSSITDTKTMKLYNRRERVDKSGVGTFKEHRKGDKSGFEGLQMGLSKGEEQLEPSLEAQILWIVYRYLKELGNSTRRENSIVRVGSKDMQRLIENLKKWNRRPAWKLSKIKIVFVDASVVGWCGVYQGNSSATGSSNIWEAVKRINSNFNDQQQSGLENSSKWGSMVAHDYGGSKKENGPSTTKGNNSTWPLRVSGTLQQQQMEVESNSNRLVHECLKYAKYLMQNSVSEVYRKRLKKHGKDLWSFRLK